MIFRSAEGDRDHRSYSSSHRVSVSRTHIIMEVHYHLADNKSEAGKERGREGGRRKERERERERARASISKAERASTEAEHAARQMSGRTERINDKSFHLPRHLHMCCKTPFTLLITGGAALFFLRLFSGFSLLFISF